MESQYALLGDLACSGMPVFLDSCVLDCDFDEGEVYAFRERSITLHSPNSFGKYLGAVKGFSELRYPRLQRHYRFISGLEGVVRAQERVSTSVAVVEDYTVLLRHFEETLRFLQQNGSSRRRGKKQEGLERIQEKHLSLYNLLNARALPLCEEAQQLAEYLCEERLHLPRGGLGYQKRYSKVREKTDWSDAALVADAFLSARERQKPVALVSVDADVMNLVRNLGKDIHHKKASLDVLYMDITAPVRVYAPAHHGWTGRGRMFLVCNNKGYATPREGAFRTSVEARCGPAESQGQH